MGALNKNVILEAPINTGSNFFNYKSTFSAVLFALGVVITTCCTSMMDQISDGGRLKNSSLCKKLEKNKLNFPSSRMADSKKLCFY